MCFSVNVNLVKEELENRYGATLIDPDSYSPSYYYHAFALPEIPVLCSGEPRSLKMLTWGLIPAWTRNPEDANEIRYKTFNARSESIDSKPSFSSSFKTKRCIVPLRGFFEWQHVGKEKVPWYIYHADDEIFSVAGLYDEWSENNTGEKFTTFSIVTTAANKLMSEIHNHGKRMPAILDRDTELKWIDISISPDVAKSLLRPSSVSNLKAHTISPLVNSRTANRNTPDVIKPYNYNQQQLLF